MWPEGVKAEQLSLGETHNICINQSIYNPTACVFLLKDNLLTVNCSRMNFELTWLLTADLARALSTHDTQEYQAALQHCAVGHLFGTYVCFLRFVSKSYRERKRETGSDPQKATIARQSQESEASSRSPRGYRGPNTWIISCCFSCAISREPNWK